VIWCLNVQRYPEALDKCVEAGVSMVRFEFNGSAAAENADEAFGDAASRGLKVCPLLQVDSNLSTANVPAFASHVAAYATRYGPSGTFWDENPALDGDLAPEVFELYNEPWGTWYGPALPAKMVQLQKAAVAAGRAANAATKYTLAVEKTSGWSYGTTWIDDLFANGLVAADFDVLAQHPYSIAGQGPTETGTNSMIWRLEAARAEFTSRGIDKPFWLTEIGWSDYEASQANIATWYGQIDEVMAPRPYVEQVTFYQLIDWGDGGQQSRFGITVWPTYAEKPAFGALQDLTETTPGPVIKSGAASLSATATLSATAVPDVPVLEGTLGDGTLGEGFLGLYTPEEPPEEPPPVLPPPPPFIEFSEAERAPVGLELESSRRAFPESQRLLGAPVERRLEGTVDLGWHGTETSDESGAVAVARLGGPYEEVLVGEVLRFSTGVRECYVYCWETADIPWDLSVSRRAFAALGGLFHESLVVTVEVVR
jgi:hypothetical protein